LLAALQAAAAGLLVREPGSGPVTGTLGAEASGTELSLTDRERDVLRLLGEGLGNREIAAILGLSDHTVKFHLHSVFAKLGAESRTEAVSIAVRRGLLLL
jgi:DNA-binding CsgD family transcriptional regulator